ncbi:Energy-coupling factor transporter transmembrane protein EcfT [Bacillus sp. THAF10]|uniref:energy-coupling factor transporter transmembrane component T n=1 Tax=Bacillus sp. THAF10 TaxID=2587848 RepID=UPI001267D78F|nr:energy-coupling factor transporter transmembrane component T [Bacillus sp. THAF10]QFT87748.1 Energy-coupling factor transporter transmembrane protein EcfT [Bacillus sp. THAF10]
MNAVIHSTHPFINLLYYICVGILFMLFLHPIFLLTSIILLSFLTILQGNQAVWRKFMPYYLVMGLIVVLMNPIFVRRGSHILFYFRNNPVTLEAIVYGVVMALLLVNILILFLSFTHVLHGRKFIFLFSKIWPQLGLLLMVTIRFVPLLTRRWREIYAIQKSRQFSMTKGSLKQRAKTGMYFMQKLLTWSLEEALQSAESMKARGYGKTTRSLYQIYRMRKSDWGLAAIFVLVTIIGMVGAKKNYGILPIYPELGSFMFTRGDLFYYLVFTSLVSIPFMMEGAERLKWRLLK